MNIRRSLVFCITIVILVFPLIGICVSTHPNIPIQSTKSNREIYLGSASIYGNGTSSVLTAEFENNVFIKTESKTEIVDFYIDYTINCDSLTDEGIISLSISKGGTNLSFNGSQSPISKSGSLYLRDIEVTNWDSFVFSQRVIYANAIPLYYNETSAMSIVTIDKTPRILPILWDRLPFLKDIFLLY